ncbi:hypothetical protein [Hyphomicrobium sp. LHD-15]|uniref:hypothetical protein n=1 Tax=Hyphomicrobium sp. LHD-15 TaxID=3072142 RepID=UPI0028108380|nr:hypothetical protein [Hyphomicrobium sp. LHD-15]MDQ8700621.1 hypothetical protein [Hyphomicrobium sp. LHD-15]
MQIALAPLGVTISEDEKNFLKPLVKCLADSGASVTIADCGKRMLAEQIPSEEARSFATCMIDTADAINCVKNAALEQLGDEVKQPARCALSGTPLNQCVTNEVLNRLPADEQEALRCLQRTRDPASCGLHYALSKDDETFQKAWGKVKSDVGTIGADVEGPIKNFVDVAIGIRENDWAKVVTAAGATATKIAGRIVLKVFLGGVGDILFGPAVDAAVDNRIGMVSGIINAAKARDPGAVAEVLVASNLGYAVFVTCAVMRSDVPITGTIIVEGVCETLGGIIMLASDVAGSLVTKIADLINFDGIVREIESILHDSRLGVMILTGEKSGKCLPIKEAYRDIYAKCYSKQAYLNLAAAPNSQSFPNDLYFKCRAHYLNCSFANDKVLERTCRSLTEQYIVDTAILTNSIESEAERAVWSSSGLRDCKFDELEQQRLASACRQHLNKTFPVTGLIDGVGTNCSESQPNTTPSLFGKAYGLYEPVCDQAVLFVGREKQRRCRDSIAIPDCDGGRDFRVGRGCVCRDGFLWDERAKQCVNQTTLIVGGACSGGMKQDLETGKCKCPDKQLWDGTKCKLVNTPFATGGGPKLPGIPPCSGGMRMNAAGQCECPPATYFSGGQCRPASVSVPGSAKDKFVFNPGGSSTNTGTEIIRKCGGRRPNGVWPNCCPPRTYYSNGMCRYGNVANGKDVGPSATQFGQKTPCVGNACCPAGTVYRSGVCRRIVVDTKLPPSGAQSEGSGRSTSVTPCPASRPVGRPPYCCPVNTRYTMGACRRTVGVPTGTAGGRRGVGPCPASRPIGRPPNCCPSGTSYSNGACRPPPKGNSNTRQHYGGAAPACKSYEIRGGDGKCYYNSQGVR